MRNELQGDEESVSPLNIYPPSQLVAASTDPLWLLVAHNKKALHGWTEICVRMSGNAQRCYEWLRAHPKRPIPKRCYALRHKHYAGAYAYEVGSGDRVYYKLDEALRKVIVYYAGSHPASVPYPPAI